jgi:hypothetical protein
MQSLGLVGILVYLNLRFLLGIWQPKKAQKKQCFIKFLAYGYTCDVQTPHFFRNLNLYLVETVPPGIVKSESDFSPLKGLSPEKDLTSDYMYG